MKNKAIIILILSIFCLASYSTQAKDDKKYVRQGNKLYENKKYNESEIKYRKALAEDPANTKAEFNLGDALYKQGNFKEAGEKFELMNNKKLNQSAKNDIQYNLGNSYFEQSRQKAKSGDNQGSMDLLNKAIDSYKGALKLDGKDDSARYNYELARRMLTQQQNQQNKQNKQNKDKKDQNKDKKDQNKNDKNKDQKNKDKQDQKKNDQNKDQKNKDKSDNKQNDQKDQNKQPEKQPTNPEPQKSKISDKDAERILNALQIQEKQKMNKMKKMKGSKSKIEKQW